MNLEYSVELVASILGGITGLGVLGRYAVTALKKQGLSDASLDYHTATLKHAQEEAHKWETRCDELQKEHESNWMLIGELRVQNRMLRILLIHQGMDATAIDKALDNADGMNVERRKEPREPKET